MTCETCGRAGEYCQGHDEAQESLWDEVEKIAATTVKHHAWTTELVRLAGEYRRALFRQLELRRARNCQPALMTREQIEAEGAVDDVLTNLCDHAYNNGNEPT